MHSLRTHPENNNFHSHHIQTRTRRKLVKKEAQVFHLLNVSYNASMNWDGAHLTDDGDDEYLWVAEQIISFPSHRYCILRKTLFSIHPNYIIRMTLTSLMIAYKRTRTQQLMCAMQANLCSFVHFSTLWVNNQSVEHVRCFSYMWKLIHSNFGRLIWFECFSFYPIPFSLVSIYTGHDFLRAKKYSMIQLCWAFRNAKCR